MINHHTLTPKEAMALLAYKLEEGGQYNTYNVDASISAIEACAVFREYLDMLPIEISKLLLELTTASRHGSISLNKILIQLSIGNCVETAAHQINSILNHNVSNKILDYKPLNEVQELSKIDKINLCLALFTTIHDVNDGLQNINKYLGSLSEEDFINAAKTKNFNGDSILHIAASDSDHRRITSILTPIDPKKRLSTIIQKNNSGNNVMHIAAMTDNLESFKAILFLIPENERLKAIKEVTNNLSSVLYLIPKERRWEIVNEKRDNEISLLDIAFRNADCLILEYISYFLPNEYQADISKLIKLSEPATSNHSSLFKNDVTLSDKNSPNMISSQCNISEIGDLPKKPQWTMPRKKKW